jgi:hypothetical protein
MSDNEAKDESTDDSEQPSEEQPTEGDQPAEQPTESDQPADEQQQAEQTEEQPADTDQPAQQLEEQPVDNDQPATAASAGNTLAFAEGAASPDDGGGGGGGTKVSARNLKVIAEFTEEGQKFIGDILIHVFESDNGQQGRLLFQTDGQYWQDTNKKGNVITTPMLRVASSQILVFAHARVLLPNGDYQTMDTQDFKIPMPSGDTLQIKFDVGVGEIEKTINAPDADKAKAIAIQSPQLKGHYVLPPGLDAQPAGNQQFRVTGKFLSGDISLL